MAILMIEDKIEKALNSFKLPEQWGVNYYDDDTSEEVECASYCVGKAVHGYVTNGITKAVIIIPNSEYVVKIPFNGYFDCTSEYNEETKEYEEGERYFTHFENANDLGEDYAECWDYCENERIKYNNAVDAGFGEFFPETRYYREKDGFPVYLQEKCKTYSFHSCTPSEEATEKSRSNKKLRCQADSRWVAAAVDYYGEERVEKFITYLNENNLGYDLHDGNLGFGKKGNPIILDFSGYREGA